MEKVIYLINLMLILFIGSCEAKNTDATEKMASYRLVDNVDQDTIGPISNVVIVDDVVIEIDGYDVSMYDLEIEYLGVEINQLDKNHVLCIAASECDLELIQDLLKDGADPNMICDVDHIVTEVSFCEEDALEITKYLLNSGSDVNGADEENTSFLSYSIMNDNKELVAYLLDHGADQEQQSTGNIGCFPIHSVASVEMLLFLIERGIDVGLRCSNGRSLLHQAIRDENNDLAEYLIKNKIVDLEVKDENGETALDYANRFNRSELVRLLKD